MTKDRRPLSHDARSVVALIATTRGRFDLLARRAIPSVLAQSRLPDRLLVVVDHTKQELDDPALKLLADTLQKQCGELEVTVLRNRRTPSRAAGAWNTAIDQMHRDARIVAQPEMWFVAILDDDDAWAPDHVALCLDEAVTRDRNMVVAGLVRHETPNDAGHPHAIPERLDAREQFIRGQHIQGSNLFVRLDLLLLVGGFDEHLPSCTDRDLCIRIAALDGLRFGRVARHTVHHFADPRHDRLSAPASQAKLDGLTRFWRKHADRFDAEARAAAAQRAKELFGWEPPVFAPATRAVPALALARNAFDIVAGFVTDARVPAHVDGLLTDLQQLRTSPGVASLRVVIVENGPLPSEGERSLRELVQTHRERGLAVELMTIERQRQDWEQGLLVDVPDPTRKRLPIAASRTVLNTYVARAAMERPRSVAWILDDDKRLSQWIDPGDGRVVERRSPDFAALCALRDAGWDVVIGPDTDAPPLPFAATLRVQLVDLAHTLAVFASLPWDSPWPDRAAENAIERAALKDSYYDLSRLTEHLETPFLAAPVAPGCTARDMLVHIAAKVGRLLPGEAVFRPLMIGVGDLAVDAATPSMQRGGSTIFFDPQHLLAYPQTLARFCDQYVRRSDMVVTQLMRDQLGLRVVMHAAAGVRHDRSATQPMSLDSGPLREDVLGYALYRAVDELMQRRTEAQRRAPLLAWTEQELKLAVRLVRKYLAERLAALTLSSWRILGLTRTIRAIADRLPSTAWPRFRPVVGMAVAQIVEEMDRIGGEFHPKAVAELARRIERGVSEADIRAAFASMDGVITEYHACHPRWLTQAPAMAEAREARARAILHRAFRTQSLRLLGMGGEGVVFTDNEQVYKALDLLKKRPNHDTLATLRGLQTRFDQPMRLYPLTKVEVRDDVLLIVYPFEPSEQYAGGRGAELIALLRECKAHGIVFRNMHPRNLRVSATGLHLVDYGSDIRLFSENGYRSMAERAWLSWRWTHRNDLDELMRRALNDKALPELDGFERFWQALRDDEPSATRVVADIVDPIVLESGARSVLDYGCGKKARSARSLAKAGLRAVGFDPGAGVAARWPELGEVPAGLTLTTSREGALAAGPFDAVVCSRVLCELANGPVYEQVLGDLRQAVREDGLVVVTICNPFATFGGPTPLHRRRMLPAGAAYDECFAYSENGETGNPRQEVHRPLRQIERDLLRHGLRVERRTESATVDLDRFEPASDFLTLVCRPVTVAHADRTCSLVIKTCAMEAATIERLVEHLVGQLEGPRVFQERVLAIDSRRDGFTRQHAASDPSTLEQVAARLVQRRWIDRIVHGPDEGPEASAILAEWFSIDSTSTHTAKGAPLATPLPAFAACRSDYILQVDSDLLVGRRDRQHDYLGEMIAALEADAGAVTIALNVPHATDTPVTSHDGGQPFRVEVRGCLLHRERLLAARPFPNAVEDGRPVLSWHRSLDEAVRSGRARSLRGGGDSSWFVHVPNAVKRSVTDWMLHLDLVEKGRLPDHQLDSVDLVGGPLAWVPRERKERLVFVITGRNVPPGRMQRCLQSLSVQQQGDWGAVLVDDGSDAVTRDYLSLALERWRGRVTLLQPRERRGQLANTVLAIRHVCTDPDTVIVTLDLDDALLGAGVVSRILEEHARGADVTVGSMLRTDKQAVYAVDFDSPRSARGGNCWQHLRTFRKRLFDAIPDHELRVDGAYVDIAVDWAFMLPIVEMATHPVWIREPLYFYEPSGMGKGRDRDQREQQIAAILGKGSRQWARGRPSSTMVLPEQLSADVWRSDCGILFLRHGDRPSLKGLSRDENFAVRLTDRGREAARAVGSALGANIGIVASPLVRAHETATEIADSAGVAREQIRIVKELVQFRADDRERYEATKRQLGWKGLIQAWIDGSLPAGVLRPCEQVARDALEAVLDAGAPSRVVAVTHDYLITALLAALRGERALAVPFLAGVFVSHEEAMRFLREGALA